MVDLKAAVASLATSLTGPLAAGGPSAAGGLVGRPLSRVDGPAKVAGSALYAAEFDVPGVLYGFPVEAGIALGRIAALDTAAAERAPGVALVLSHLNAPPQAAGEKPTAEGRFMRPVPVFDTDRVNHHGQHVALVVADTYERARAAAALVRVTYEAEAGLFDRDAAEADAYAPKEINGGDAPESAKGDFARAFAAAPYKLDATYETPPTHNNPIEPHAAIAAWEGGRLTVHTTTQNPSWARTAIAKSLGLKEEAVRVVCPYVGGGFGSKVPTYAHVIEAATAARVLGRPVKVVLTRQQMFPTTAYRTSTKQRMRLGADAEGTLLALAHDSLLVTSNYDEFVEQASVLSRVMYAADDRLTTHRVTRLNLPTPNIKRAPGEAPGSFASECAMDELAAALGMDPIALRERNEPSVDPETGLPFSSRHLLACLSEGAKAFGWERRRAPGEARDGRWLVGVGVAASTYPARALPCAARVTLRRDPAGGIVAVAELAASDLGTGTYTVLSQLVGDALGLPLARVRVVIGDSDLPKAPASGGSFGAASFGSAVEGACGALRTMVAELARNDAASPLRGVNADDLVFEGGRVGARDDAARSEPLAELIARSAPPEGVVATHQYVPGADRKRYSHHAFGAQFVEVGVDADTGEVRARRVLGAFAVGRVLNPKTARSQLIGGMTMGLGMALMEETLIDPRSGAFVNHDLAEYHVPVNADVPEMDALLLEERDPHGNPIGIKGVGEIGIVGTAAAVANAVFNATGTRVRALPLTLDKVLGSLPHHGH